MIRKKPVFDYADCLNCSICVQACPISCLRLSLKGRQGKYVNLFPEMVSDKCTGCGICASACPMDVIEMKEQPPEE